MDVPFRLETFELDLPPMLAQSGLVRCMLADGRWTGDGKVELGDGRRRGSEWKWKSFGGEG